MELDILKDIVGRRYNEERQQLFLQTVQFGSRIENKRYLVDMLDRLVLACQRLAKEATSSESAALKGGDRKEVA